MTKKLKAPCPKCKGTGMYAYDENHSTICDLCCTHSKGWWKLSKDHYGYKKGKNMYACKNGCGTTKEIKRRKKMTKKDVAMQVRCIFCKKEQYAPAVWEISHGKHPCVWCGKTPEVMTERKYLEELRKGEKK